MTRYAIQILGLLALLSPSACAVSYQYDALHRLTKATYDNGVEIIYAYDAVGNRTTRTLYRPLVAAAHWSFDETSGNKAADSAGESLGDVYGAQWTVGRLGNALWFDGVDDSVTCSHSPVLAPSRFTIGLWVSPEPVGGTRSLIMKAGTGGVQVDYKIDLTSMNRVMLTFGDQKAKSAFLLSGSSLKDSVWTYVVVSRDGSTAKVWIDGVLDGSQAYDLVADSGSYKLVVGGGQGAPYKQPFKGKIDDVCIYDQALSADTIKGLYDEASK